MTDDGGATWRPAGASLPVAPERYAPIAEQVFAGSTGSVYVLAGDGAVLASRNAGTTWVRQPLPRPVFELAMSSGTLWALACPATPNRSTDPALAGLRFCRPVLERAPASSGRWTQVRTPPVTRVLDVRLALASTHLQVLDIDHPGGRRGGVLYSRDGGRRWGRGRTPTWDGIPCLGSDVVAAGAAPRTWWILCLGNGAAGSSTKGLMRTTDYGRTWETVSEVTSLLAPPPRASSISLAEPDALAAGSSTRLWLADQNSMRESGDGGASWTDVPGVDPQGVAASFDVLSSTHAWLTVPGEGLWRTTDGRRWTPVSAPKPCMPAQLGPGRTF